MRYRASDESFITHHNKLIELPAEALVTSFQFGRRIFRLFRFTVEERILGRCADRNGEALTTAFKDTQTLGGQASGEHHTGIYPMIGSRGASRTDGYTDIYTHDGAWHTLRSVCTLGVATMAAIQAMGMFARTYYYYTLGIEDVVGIAEEKLESVFLVDGYHFVGQSLDVLVRHHGNLDDIYPLAFRCGTGCGHHLSGDVQHLFVTGCSFVQYHDYFLSINDLNAVG